MKALVFGVDAEPCTPPPGYESNHLVNNRLSIIEELARWSGGRLVPGTTGLPMLLRPGR